MTSRNQLPPVNLKERIAALQQRNVSPPPASPAASATTVPNSAGVRDRIARFEKKGVVPVPRGSFGLGAPPPPENAPGKRRGELYGNRIPSAKALTGSQSDSRSASPFETSRSFSLPAIEGESNELLRATNDPLASPVSPFLGSSVEHATGGRPTPRGTAYMTAVELAKQAEVYGEIIGTRSTSTSPPAVETAGNDEAAPVSGSPVSVVVSDERAIANGRSIGLDVPNTILNSPTTPLVDSPVVNSPPASQPDHPKVAVAIAPVVVAEPEPIVASSPAKPSEPVSRTATPPQGLPSIPEVNIQPPVEATSTAKHAIADDDVNKGLASTIVTANSGTTTSTTELAPNASPIGPFSLANAVQDLGKVVANIQDMFPGQMSPITSPLPYRSFRAPEAPQTAAPVQPAASKLPPSTLSEVPKTAMAAVAVSKAEAGRKLAHESSHLLSTPGNTAARPNTMFETSSTQGPQVSRGTGQPHPSTLGKKNYEHFPPTPNVADEFGAIPSSGSGHQKARSVSESSNKPSSFSARVYKKVTELPSVAAASSTTSFYSPINAGTGTGTASALPEISLLSPGFGELSSLLQDATLLEFTLGQGEAPTGKGERKEEQVQPKSEQVKEEEMQRNETPVPTAPTPVPEEAKQASADASMRRSKSWKRDTSTDGRITPTRSRTLNGPRSRTSTSDSRDAASTLDTSAASQISPKSQKGYFTTLRRLASSSKTSVNTAYSSGHPRYSASTSSEASTEDSHLVMVPPGIDVTAASSDPVKNGTRSPSLAGSTSPAASLSSKKSPMSRAASFAGSMFGRSKKTNTNSAVNNPYEAIERLAKSKTNKSAAALMAPIEPGGSNLEVPGAGLPSPPDRLVSPRRHSSLMAPTTSFEPDFSTRPTSSVWGTLPSPQGPSTVKPPSNSVNLDAFFAAKPTSPIYTAGGKQSEISLDAAFAADITSSVYIPPSPHPAGNHQKAPSTRTAHTAASSRSFLQLSPPSPSEGFEADIESPGGMSLLPSPSRPPNRPPSSDESDLGFSTPLAESFPPVPLTAPAVQPKTPVSAAPYSAATTSGRQPRPLPSLPMRGPSFFESAPLSSAVGSEFMPSATLPAKSATVREQRR